MTVAISSLQVALLVADVTPPGMTRFYIRLASGVRNVYARMLFTVLNLRVHVWRQEPSMGPGGCAT